LERFIFAAVAFALLFDCPASAQTAQPEVTIWNGTSVLLKFTYASSGQSFSADLASNQRSVFPCSGSANLSIVTEASPFETNVPCNSSYGLYYNESTRRYEAKPLPVAAIPQQAAPPPAAQPSPLQQLLINRRAAAVSRSGAGLEAAPEK
jgi:hypothetical protein